MLGCCLSELPVALRALLAIEGSTCHSTGFHLLCGPLASGIIKSKNGPGYERSHLLRVAISADCARGGRAGIHGISGDAGLAGEDMLPGVRGAFHHFVGATKEALTTAKILL
jgi:hypothetical protein